LLFGVFIQCFSANQCQVADAQSESKTNRIGNVLKPFYEQVEKIEEAAAVQGRQLVTELSMERVLTTFFKPFPKLMRLVFLKRLIKGSSNPHIGYLIPLRFSDISVQRCYFNWFFCSQAQGRLSFMPRLHREGGLVFVDSSRAARTSQCVGSNTLCCFDTVAGQSELGRICVPFCVPAALSQALLRPVLLTS